MRLDFKASVPQNKVQFVLYLGQSVVDYICSSNLPMNIYDDSELSPLKIN